jgi:hypothetical protein
MSRPYRRRRRSHSRRANGSTQPPAGTVIYGVRPGLFSRGLSQAGFDGSTSPWNPDRLNLVPDHATIARFVVRHEAALGELFGELLRLCDQAGVIKPGLVAIDRTRFAGNESCREPGV